MRNQSRISRLAATLVCLLGLLAVFPALADTQTGNQNPDLSVTVTIASSGSDPEQATVGDTVTATWTVANETKQDLPIKVEDTMEPPGIAVHTEKRDVTLAAHHIYTHAVSYHITSDMPKGTFYAVVRATDDLGTGYKAWSGAAPSVTIY